MADLTGGTSTWSTGTADTASTLQNGVDQKRAEHENGPNAAILGLQSKLGPAASLVGTKTDLATRLAIGISSSGVLTSAEPGDIMMSARGSKTGWLLCNGTSYLRTDFPDLFAAIGTAYGSVDGTHFNVPNYSSRFPIGAGTGVGGGTSGAAGTTPAGGATLNTLNPGQWAGGEDANTIAHVHSITDVQHSHVDNGGKYTDAGGSNPGSINVGTDSTGQAAPVSNSFSGITGTNSTGVSGTDLNLPPYLACYFWIKT